MWQFVLGKEGDYVQAENNLALSHVWKAGEVEHGCLRAT